MKVRSLGWRPHGLAACGVAACECDMRGVRCVTCSVDAGAWPSTSPFGPDFSYRAIFSKSKFSLCGATPRLRAAPPPCGHGPCANRHGRRARTAAEPGQTQTQSSRAPRPHTARTDHGARGSDYGGGGGLARTRGAG